MARAWAISEFSSFCPFLSKNGVVMWRSLWTRLSLRSRTRISNSTSLRFHARLPQPIPVEHVPVDGTGTTSRNTAGVSPNRKNGRSIPDRPRQIHRQKVLATQLAHTRLCSPSRAARLAEMGIITCEDLYRANLEAIAKKFKARGRALATLKLYRRSIRLAASIDGLVPIDALALVSIHRRTVASLSSQSAAMLHRDLARFAESSSGRALLRGRRLPSTKRIRKWIDASQKIADATVHPKRTLAA